LGALWNADCVEVMRGLPENSVHYSIFSPPFASLYTFSDDPSRDVSNNSDDRVFWEHYRFVIEGVTAR
jgi:DNA modification methylase